MCRFFESIQLKDGDFKRLSFHQTRVDSVFERFFSGHPSIHLASLFNEIVYPNVGLIKCRIIFDKDYYEIDFQQYKIREIRSLKIVETDMESMPYKSENRKKLIDAFDKRLNCDDVLLVKNGFLTDTSYTNVALYDGANWMTPRLPLIYGVNRAELLEKNIILEKDILLSELSNYKKIRLFNAMIKFGEIELEMDSIFF